MFLILRISKFFTRIKKSSSQENFEDIEWVYFNEDGSPDIDVIATAENSISGISEKQSSYQELSYSVEIYQSSHPLLSRL